MSSPRPTGPSGKSNRNALFAVSAALLGARLFAASRLGFGDGEALYAVYGLHPAPAYVDHPGFIGVIARSLASDPERAVAATRAHVFTAFGATLVPLVMVLAARLVGAPPRRAWLLGLITALVPELAIGLFGLTPDLPLALFFPLSAGLVGFALRTGRADGDRAFPSHLALLAAGACAGLSAISKIPGLVLIPWLFVSASLLGKQPRWLVLAASLLGSLIFLPVALFELTQGAPMLWHRLVHTQSNAGFSLRNAGALIGGQLVYASPCVAIAAAWITVRLWQRHRTPLANRSQARLDSAASALARDPVSLALLALTLATGFPLAVLCLWSRVAEPHWFAPTLLPLGLLWARRPPTISEPARFWTVVRRGLLPTAGALVVLVHVYVLTDVFPRLAGASYEGKYDLANDMMLYPRAGVTLREAVLVAKLHAPRAKPAASLDGDVDVVVVAPHWAIAAQAATELPVGTRVTTATLPDAPDDDFQRWVTPAERNRASLVVWVSDDRFPLRIPPALAARPVLTEAHYTLERAGRPVRTLTVQTLGPGPSDDVASLF
jgi:hypothetical protein